ncbi:MAG: hypothetical protein LBV22_02365, partial [Mycoplasmataceae bacterium]|nr:hypothetical protein [Mycoplasmataceae bacterium]
DVNSLDKKDKDSFLYYFFKKYASIWIPTDTGPGDIEGKGGIYDVFSMANNLCGYLCRYVCNSK